MPRRNRNADQVIHRPLGWTPRPSYEVPQDQLEQVTTDNGSGAESPHLGDDLVPGFERRAEEHRANNPTTVPRPPH